MVVSGCSIVEQNLSMEYMRNRSHRHTSIKLHSRLNDLLHQWKRLDEQNEKFLTAKDPVIFEYRYTQEGIYDRYLTWYSAANATLLHLISEKGNHSQSRGII